jgi:hypothetical protein
MIRACSTPPLATKPLAKGRVARHGRTWHLLTTYAVAVEQSRNAAHADTELFGYLGCGAGPVEVDHGLEVLGRSGRVSSTSVWRCGPRCPRQGPVGLEATLQSGRGCSVVRGLELWDHCHEHRIVRRAVPRLQHRRGTGRADASPAPGGPVHRVARPIPPVCGHHCPLAIQRCPT